MLLGPDSAEHSLVSPVVESMQLLSGRKPPFFLLSDALQFIHY